MSLVLKINQFRKRVIACFLAVSISLPALFYLFLFANVGTENIAVDTILNQKNIDMRNANFASDEYASNLAAHLCYLHHGHYFAYTTWKNEETTAKNIEKFRLNYIIMELSPDNIPPANAISIDTIPFKKSMVLFCKIRRF